MSSTLENNFEMTKLPCICGSINYKILGYRGGEAHKSQAGLKSKIVKCKNCGHIYPYYMPIINDTNKIYKTPDKYFINNDSDEKINRNARLIKKIENITGFKGKLLDVGSGIGEMVYVAQKSGWDVQGVETSKEFVEYAKEKYGIDINNCSLEDMKYQDNTFDVITLGAVIEHLYYPQIILKEMYRILKPNGIIWVDAPNECSDYNIVGNAYFKILGKKWVTNLSPTFEPYHVQGFSKKSIKHFLKSYGFVVEELKTYDNRSLLPQMNLKQKIVYFSAYIVSLISHVTNNKSFMEVLALKK